MSRNTSQARHRADVDGSIALQGLSRAAKSHAVAVGRPVAIVAVTSGLALSVVGTANASAHTDQAPVQAPVAAPVAPAAAGTSHTVVAGDTLGGISAQYGVELHAVLAANGLSLSSVIFPGDSIVVPAAGEVSAPVQTVAVAAPVETVVAPVEQAAPVAPFEQAAAVAPAPAVSTAPDSGVYLASASIAPVAPAASAATSAPAESAVGGNVAGILVGSAQSQIGTTQDCTAMVEKALRAAGFTVGDLGPSQFFQFGATVGTPAPGDLVITGGHVAIYVGNGQVISGGMNGINATMQHPLSDLPGASFVRVAR
jgi:LysM repeat protein